MRLVQGELWWVGWDRRKGTKSKSISLDLRNWWLVVPLPGMGRMMEEPSVRWRMRDHVHSFGCVVFLSCSVFNLSLY